MRIVLLIFTLSLLSSLPVLAKDEPMTDQVWVLVRPVQCLGNPWEKQWLAKHNNRGAEYPRQKEYEFIKAFFTQKGIPILDFRFKPYEKGDSLSPACDSPRGDTLYLLINSRDTPKMVRLGYSERLPARQPGLPNKKTAP